MFSENINLVQHFNQCFMKRKSTFIILILCGMMLMFSCRSGRVTKQQRYAEKSQLELEKENEAMVEAYKEHHFEIQADETQKMIKKSKKRAKKLNRKKGDSFFERIFKRNRSKGCEGN